MVGVNEDPMGLPQRPPALAGRKSDHSWVFGALLFLIVIAGLAGIVVAMMSGQPTIAFIIGLFTAAIVAGSTC
jgi:hypothetical protein